MNLGLSNVVQNGTALKLDLNFDADGCGCSTPTSPSGGSSTVTWANIQGKPECILDCATLLTYIRANGLFNLQSSDQTVISVDGNGIHKVNLTERGTVGIFGDASKTVRLTLSSTGVVTAAEEVDIAVDAANVTYDNPTYQDVDSALDYLFGAIKLNFTYQQITAATTWTITHNLGYRPNFTVLDSAGNTAIGNVTYNSANQLTLTFSQAISGFAYLS